MSKLIYSIASLDGYVADEDRRFDWAELLPEFVTEDGPVARVTRVTRVLSVPPTGFGMHW